MELPQAQHTERNMDIAVVIRNQSVEHCRQQHRLHPRDEEGCHETLHAGCGRKIKTDGTKKDVSDRRGMMMLWDASTSVAEAEKLIKESARATGKLGVNGSESTPTEPVTSQLQGSPRASSR